MKLIKRKPLTSLKTNFIPFSYLWYSFRICNKYPLRSVRLIIKKMIGNINPAFTKSYLYF